jgi:hypothetical protein
MDMTDEQMTSVRRQLGRQWRYQLASYLRRDPLRSFELKEFCTTAWAQLDMMTPEELRQDTDIVIDNLAIAMRRSRAIPIWIIMLGIEIILTIIVHVFFSSAAGGR